MKSPVRSQTQGDESIVKKLKAKCQAKDKDKNSTLDTHPTAKSTIIKRNQKTNTSNNTNNETTSSSQMLSDLSYKEHSGLKGNTSKPFNNADRQTPSSPPKTNSTSAQFKSSDLSKMLATKDKEIYYLEESKASVVQDIDDAVQYIHRNKDLASLLLQKDHKIKVLRAQLDSVMQNIETSKLSHKRNLISDSNRQNKPISQDTSKTKESHRTNKDLSSFRSLSPGLEKIVTEPKEKKPTRYQMYKENAKTLAPQLFKSKTYRDSSSHFSITNSQKKSPHKRLETSPEYSHLAIAKHPKTQKSHSIIGDLASPTSRSVKNPLHAFLINSHRGISKQRIEVSPQPEDRIKTEIPSAKSIQSHRVVSSTGGSGSSRKKISLKSKREVERIRGGFEIRRHTENDLSESYGNMLERFVDFAEKYKEKARRLEERNKELELTIEQMKSKEKLEEI